MKKRVLLIMALFLVFIIGAEPLFGKQWLVYYDRPIKGIVVDAATGKPVKGVLVIGMWQLSQFLSQGFGGYAKIIVKETDDEGKFTIPFWVTFKPWTLNSAMRDGAPGIVFYRPGYKFSHRVLLDRYPTNMSQTAAEKEMVKETNSINPAKLIRTYTDEEIWQNHHDFRSQAHFPFSHYSRKQLSQVFDLIQDSLNGLPENLKISKEKILKDLNEDKNFYLRQKK